VSKRGGRVYLYIEKKHWDRVNKKCRSVKVETLGYVDDLMKTYPDPIAYFRQKAKEMTLAENEQKTHTVTLDLNERLETDSNLRYNLGYVVILKVFHELELHRFLNNKQRHEAFKYNTNTIIQMLVIERLLNPGSKRAAFKGKDQYFERFSFDLEDVYKALDHYANIATEMQRWASGKAEARYGRDTSILYYDVTNYYFEIDAEDELRRFGKSKEGRKSPITQMGLCMDADGIPLHYELFPGNTLDKQTFRNVIGEVRRNYDTWRIIAVADMGIITGDNIYYLKDGDRDTRQNGYVFSFSVRGGTKEFKEYVADMPGYKTQDGKTPDKDSDYMIKSRFTPREIMVTVTDGKKTRKVKKTIDEKQVVFWGRKYQAKARAEREAVIKKARDIIAHPAKYDKRGAYGADKYVKGILFDNETGEIIKGEETLSFNEDQLREDEKYDGYYAIVSSELELADPRIIEIYRGLWEIEETFKISKSVLETRPMYVRTKEHIHGHVLTCFIALLIVRLIQKKTGKRFSAEKIASELGKVSCSHEQENVYLFDYRSEVTDALGEAFDLDFTRKRMTLEAIKKVSAAAKSPR
jgi:transposase